MAKAKTEPQAAPAPIGDNTDELVEIVQVADDECGDLEAKREQINAEILAIRKRVKAAGIPLKVFDHARRIREMEEDDRRDYDNMMELVREALSVPQGQLPLEHATPGNADEGAATTH